MYLLFALVALVTYEIGYRVGRWWQERTPDEVQGPSGILVGSLLALMAFLLAVTMGMASDRFDMRRQLVLEEANAIGTVYLRAGFLPQPASDQTRELLRDYAPQRVDTADEAQLQVQFARSGEIQDRLWAIAEPLVRESPDSQALALYSSALNDMFDVGEARQTAIEYARVPETVVLLVFAGSALILGMVGFHAGLTRRRSSVGAVILVIVLGALITLIVDLDRPRRGFLQVSQQPLIDVIEEIGPPKG